MVYRSQSFAIRSLAAVALLAVSLHAQTGQGIITGVVTDKTGAVVPGVNIRLTAKESGFSIPR